MISKSDKKPRGIRNNNPLNIRVGNDWIGEVDHPTDHTFEQFRHMKYGVRAAFVVLHNYITRHQLNTVPKIIKRWAPPYENVTDRYIRNVCKRMDIKDDVVIVWSNKSMMLSLFQAMCIEENGETIPMYQIEEGYDLAEILYK